MSHAMKSGFHEFGMKEKNHIKTLSLLFKQYLLAAPLSIKGIACKIFDDDLGKARAASQDAAQTRAEYEADLDVARSAAAETAKTAAAEAAKKAEASDAKIAKKLADKVAKAESKLANARSDALGNLNDVAAETAMVAVAQLADIKTTAVQAGKTADKLAAQMARQETN